MNVRMGEKKRTLRQTKPSSRQHLTKTLFSPFLFKALFLNNSSDRLLTTGSGSRNTRVGRENKTPEQNVHVFSPPHFRTARDTRQLGQLIRVEHNTPPHPTTTTLLQPPRRFTWVINIKWVFKDNSNRVDNFPNLLVQ